MKTFYLGTHQPHWLSTAGVPLFVSHRRLMGRKSLPPAIEQWALDSGGFSELSLYGEWRTTPKQYIDAVKRYDSEIGHLGWAAPQDWMCEPIMLARTGLTVEQHQHRTVKNFLTLQDLWGSDSPFMPVIQGWKRDDYLKCMDLYDTAGVDLSSFPLVGLGSVCRRQHTGEIGNILESILALDADMPLHGFGVKLQGLRDYGHLLNSADSMAWSYNARRNQPLPGCAHNNCANCLLYAMRWREKVDTIRYRHQLSLFTEGVA